MSGPQFRAVRTPYAPAAYPAFGDELRIAIIVCALTGCAPLETTKPPPEIQVRTVTNIVKVSDPVDCFSPADKPVVCVPPPVDVDKATTDQLGAATAADNKCFDLYTRNMEKLFAKCSVPGVKP